jgi:hypothetical protein
MAVPHTAVLLLLLLLLQVLASSSVTCLLMEVGSWRALWLNPRQKPPASARETGCWTSVSAGQTGRRAGGQGLHLPAQLLFTQWGLLGATLGKYALRYQLALHIRLARCVLQLPCVAPHPACCKPHRDVRSMQQSAQCHTSSPALTVCLPEQSCLVLLLCCCAADGPQRVLLVRRSPWMRQPPC